MRQEIRYNTNNRNTKSNKVGYSPNLMASLIIELHIPPSISSQIIGRKKKNIRGTANIKNKINFLQSGFRNCLSVIHSTP